MKLSTNNHLEIWDSIVSVSYPALIDRTSSSSSRSPPQMSRPVARMKAAVACRPSRLQEKSILNWYYFISLLKFDRYSNGRFWSNELDMHIFFISCSRSRSVGINLLFSNSRQLYEDYCLLNSAASSRWTLSDQAQRDTSSSDSRSVPGDILGHAASSDRRGEVLAGMRF